MYGYIGVSLALTGDSKIMVVDGCLNSLVLLSYGRYKEFLRANICLDLLAALDQGLHP
jgi:hypothetical protein